MILKTFLLGFIVIYILISLPAILGIGYVIDWVTEATFYQKFKGYVIEGFTTNYFPKIVISIVIGGIFTLFLAKRNSKLN